MIIMSNISDNFHKKRLDRRSKKTSTWANLIVKVILLVFVIIIIRNLSNPDNSIFFNFFNNKSNNMEIMK
ncbi:MAG: hypothetical protein K8S23_14140 [Candidatus Cloacimonetes bacterium]|nr:hypothetical protein [Candidatus Cloacimonadota bacterium]